MRDRTRSLARARFGPNIIILLSTVSDCDGRPELSVCLWVWGPTSHVDCRKVITAPSGTRSNPHAWRTLLYRMQRWIASGAKPKRVHVSRSQLEFDGVRSEYA
jgi:hypothetical protein